MHKKLKVAVLGSTGYVGMELVKLLSKHQNININFLGSDSETGAKLKSIDGKYEYKNLPVLNHNKEFDCTLSDYVFLALPHSISNKFVKEFFGKINIIDLSADFRLDKIEVYNKDYGHKHSCSEYLKDFTYGLVEIYREHISTSKNIAVPGCYPTSILLPLIPLITEGVLNTNNIIIDSKSGFSGAGKKFDLKKIKNNSDYNFFYYNTNSHRHISEIKQELTKNSNEEIEFSFNPHVLPNFRGMMSTIYCDLNSSFHKKDIETLLSDFANKNQFINYFNNNMIADFFSVQNTNNCNIKLLNHHSENKIIIVSVIDNLIKGAAGQALQCFNLSAGLDETTALL